MRTGKRKESRKLKRYVRNVFTTSFIILFVCVFFGAFLVSAHEKDLPQETLYTYYKSIEIQPGDTLWDIAEATMTSQFDSVPEYVEAIKDMNQLESDEIHYGQHLIIAYEDTVFIP